MLGRPDLEVEKISSSTYGWKRILVALNGEFSEPRQLKLPPQTTFATFLERSSALHELGRFRQCHVDTITAPLPNEPRLIVLLATANTPSAKFRINATRRLVRMQRSLRSERFRTMARRYSIWNKSWMTTSCTFQQAQDSSLGITAVLAEVSESGAAK